MSDTRTLGPTLPPKLPPTQPVDWDREARLLCSPVGLPGSGRLRYGAAMQFRSAGLLGDGELEVYRICSASDGDDPARLLAERGLPLPEPAALTPAQHIRTLIEACADYLARHPGPGVTEARHGLARWRNGAITPAPRAHPVVAAHLGTALDAVAADEPTLAAAVAAAAPHLGWTAYDGYPPEAIGPAFAAGHAYASLIGEGPIVADDYDVGLFLIAPHLLYRDHAHPAPELYAPLTGPHGWRFGPDAPLIVLPAHRPVWNQPNAPHLTKVGPVPFLCLYAWTADVDAAAHIVPADDWPTLETLRLDA